MIKLFKYEGYKITISEEALLLKPFRNIWNRDRSINKEKALLELGYIYFFCDPRSIYMDIIDEDDRHIDIIKGEGLPSNWKPDAIIKEAMVFYSSFKPMASALLESTKKAIYKLQLLLEDIDLERTDERGKPIYNLQTVPATVEKILTLVPKLDAAEKSLSQDIVANSKMRGQAEKTIFDDDIMS